MKNKVVLFLTIFLAFVTGGSTVVLLTNINNKDNNTTTEEKTATVYNSCSNCMSGTMVVNNEGISKSVKKIYDSVVMVKIYKNGKASGSGSGFVYKKDDKYGYVMTNHHVIEGATSITIKLTSEEEVDGTLLGSDEYLDIAIVRIPKEKVISVAKIGSSTDIELGEQVFTVGTPVSENYFNTITGGYISGINRLVTVSVKANNDWIQEVLQIDAAINPGNSGGPLVNFNGEVIGVTSLKLVDSSIEGMGFAIKIEDALKHINDLENGNKIQRPMLGITHSNITETYTLRTYGISLDESIKYGIVILDVEKGSGADKAGLQKGDVIIKLNKDKTTNMAYLKYLLYKYNVGDTIEITYIRGKEEKTTSVTLTEYTD